ncbi:MAG: DinB family protein [Bacteroidota bacterium]
MQPPPTSLASDDRLRHELTALLRGRQAHVDAHTVLDQIPLHAVNQRPGGAEHSLWQLAEHLRITQADILAFCHPGYIERDWPADYWPRQPASAGDWEACLDSFFADFDALLALAASGDLFAEFAWAPGYTLLRELLLAADHNAYHLGQIVQLRRALGLWPPAEST